MTLSLPSALLPTGIHAILPSIGSVTFSDVPLRREDRLSLLVFR
jgi:hypothetical protein